MGVRKMATAILECDKCALQKRSATTRSSGLPCDDSRSRLQRQQSSPVRFPDGRRGIGEILSNIEAAFSGQYRFVPKRHPDLFERRMAAMGEFRKCTAQIVRSDCDSQLLGIAPNDKVNGLRAEALAEFTVLSDGAK